MRPRWGVRTSNPGGAARRSLVGSNSWRGSWLANYAYQFLDRVDLRNRSRRTRSILSASRRSQLNISRRAAKEKADMVEVEVACGNLDKENCAGVVPEINGKTVSQNVRLNSLEFEGQRRVRQRAVRRRRPDGCGAGGRACGPVREAGLRGQGRRTGQAALSLRRLHGRARGDRRDKIRGHDRASRARRSAAGGGRRLRFAFKIDPKNGWDAP